MKLIDALKKEKGTMDVMTKSELDRDYECRLTQGETRLTVRNKNGKKRLEIADVVKFIVKVKDGGEIWKIRFHSDGFLTYRYFV